MTRWFRSEAMDHVMLLVKESEAHEIFYELGKKSTFQLIDLNWRQTAFERRYSDTIKRMNELERVLRFFQNEFEELGIPLLPPPEPSTFLTRMDVEMRETPDFGARMKVLETTFEESERDLRRLNADYSQLLKAYTQNQEQMYVLRHAREHQAFVRRGGSLSASSTTADDGSIVRFNRLTGVVNSTDRQAFERMTFRYTRGKCLLQFFQIYDGPTSGGPAPYRLDGQQEDRDPVKFIDPVSGEKLNKLVFVAIFPGQDIGSKVRKICSAFGATIYDVPDAELAGGELESKIREVTTDMVDSKRVIDLNRKNASSLAQELLANFYKWQMTVKVEKAVFVALNKCRVNKSGYIEARGWVLSDALEEIATMVRTKSGDGGAQLTKVQTHQAPPTHFYSNKVTEVFQGTINTYGVPRYQEANPSVLSLVTFPFLFGVMFGDLGHGTLMLCCASFIVYNEKKFGKQQLGDIGQMAYYGRYMLLLMSCFSIYMGLIYNEMFSITLDVFGTTWHYADATAEEALPLGCVNGKMPDDTLCAPDRVYPFGFDPEWLVSQNVLTFQNSFKMKLSVILGVGQMTMGIVMKGTNAVYFKDRLTLIFEWIPQMLFMCCLFGYMDYLIFLKWVTPRGGPCPSLINTMINMALGMGSLNGEDELYSGQESMQFVLLIVAVLSVPVMLLVKPLLTHRANQAHADHLPVKSEPEDEDYPPGHGSHGHGDSLMDLLIHQGIETIEFVLGCVSNTASYLRLWALSLAHAELAKTFWDMTIAAVLNQGGSLNFIMLVVAYAAFAGITISVLMGMDALECYLHALRLHWVEFMNKFYMGDGYLFAPFSFDAVLQRKK